MKNILFIALLLTTFIYSEEAFKCSTGEECQKDSDSIQVDFDSIQKKRNSIQKELDLIKKERHSVQDKIQVLESKGIGKLTNDEFIKFAKLTDGNLKLAEKQIILSKQQTALSKRQVILQKKQTALARHQTALTLKDIKNILYPNSQ